jgi:ADP-ribose pyrophosphatase YjhB (NUDIX family)
MTNTELTQEEVETIASLLEKISPGLLPLPIFKQVARLLTTVTVVLVPLMTVDNKIKVLLTQREETDPYYPGYFHPPGTILRASDETVQRAFERLLTKELHNPQVKTQPVFVNFVHEQIGRGREVALVHWIELEAKGNTGEFFDGDNLPEKTYPTDIPRIRMAVKHFKTVN